MIRSVEPADVRRWAEMRAALWGDADPSELLAEVSAFVDGSIVPTIAAAFIADGEAGPAGFVELSVRAFSDGCASMPVPHIEGWFVEPHARSRGVGRRLLAAAETWARTHGFREIASDAEIHNERSVQAHAHCGYEEVERLVKFRKPLV